ncbi:peptidylprolyl isomerase [Alkalicoccus daliensis]|uniref:Peptidyl-prolyl cis-trans isomerase n=1 Tax=Alkalicoccus daliensis TaxID=745820 RepID=A0A1H0AEQ1_9BACI|nr:peptidylprolyl isomerase [Alkalicoccus daliensis]SDN31915.1 peptidyl-prolyl cis-trans isomerase B (cyclophilin B) [Alkalicoccus daliensis]
MLHKKKFLTAAAGIALLTACGDTNNENAAEENHQEEANSNAEETEQNEQSEIEEEENENNSAAAVTEGGLEMPQISGETESLPQAVIETNMGDIEVVFYPEKAPLAVENFLTLAEEDYYNDVIFHRVIEDFMIQGGDPSGTGMGGESAFGEAFEDEFDPSLAHFNGALSMANSGPDSNGSQFFIVQAGSENLTEEMFEESGFPEETIEHYLEVGGTPHLDNRHTVFGHVISGMDVVDEIATVETEGADMPAEDIVIEDIVITEDME